MFKVQMKDYTSRAKPFWRDMMFYHRFETEAQAWAYVGSLDEDGFVDRRSFRVVRA